MNKNYTIFIISIFLISSFLTLNGISTSQAQVDNKRSNSIITNNENANMTSRPKIITKSQSKLKKEMKPLSTNNYILQNYDPISINGNAQLTAANGVSSGSGTNSDPYRIDKIAIWNSSANHLLDIENTNKPLIISNSDFSAKDTNGINTAAIGIYLYNTTNIQIVGSIFYDVTGGVVGTSANSTDINTNSFYYLNPPGGNVLSITNSSFVTIENNIVTATTNHNYYGVVVERSTNVYIINNTISNTLWAVFTWGDGNLVINKNFFYNNYIDLEIDSENFVQIKDNIFNSSVILNFDVLGSSHDLIRNNTINNSAENSMNIAYGSNNNIIEANTISNTTWSGFQMDSSKNNVIRGNLITGSGQHGIYLTSSNNNTIVNNTIIGIPGTLDSIFLESSNFNNITSNIIEKARNLLIIQHSNLNYIANCEFLQSLGNATLLNESTDTIIFNSNFDSSSVLGIVLLNGTADRVIENTFMGSEHYSLFIYKEHGAFIEYNAFDGSDHYLSSQAYDDGNNRFIYNYWSGWTTPDKNGDGIVDQPYAIDGPSFISDPMPLTSINEIGSISIVSSTSAPFTVVLVPNTSNLLNNITNSTTKGSSGLPGLTLPSLIASFIVLGVMIIIRRKKGN